MKELTINLLQYYILKTQNKAYILELEGKEKYVFFCQNLLMQPFDNLTD